MPRKSRKKRKARSFWPWGIAILLVIAAGTTLGVLIQRNLLPVDLPAGAQLIPQEAVGAIALSADINQWQQLRAFGSSETQAATDSQLANWRNTYLGASGLDFQRDIQPWAGKQATIAYLPEVSAPAASVNQPALVAVLPIANPAALSQLESNPQAAKLVERNYKGISIRESPAGEKPLAIAVVDKFVAIANSGQAIERVIDTAKGAPSIVDTPGYAAALRQIPAKGAFARIFVNIPAAVAATAATSGRTLAPDSLAQAQQKQGIAANVFLEAEGIRWRGISWFKSNSQQTLAVENNAKSMAGRLPAETLLSIAGGNLQRLWQDYAQGAPANPLNPIGADSLKAAIKARMGLDLEQDLLPWMAGEFSLSLVSTPKGTPSSLGAAVVLAVQTNDRRAAETTLQQLDVVMAKEYQFYVQQTQLGDRPVVTWTSPLNGLSATRGWLDDNVAFLILGAPITNAIAPKPKQPLSDNPLFQQTVASGLAPNNGYFFIDVEQTINKGNLALPQLSPPLKKYANAIQAIGVTAAVTSDRSSQFEIAVLLKKG